MALTKISTDGVKDDAVTTDKLANAINTERTANTAKVSLEADSVTGAKIADDAVGAEHIEQLDADLSFADSAKAKFGASNDLEISHDGSNSKIHHGGDGGLKITTADFQVQTTDGSEWIMRGQANGALDLYYDHSKKAFTGSTGFNINGNCDLVNDNNKLQLGNDADLKIYHSGTGSYIDNEVGSLYIRDTGGAEKVRINGYGTAITGGLLFGTDTAAANALDDYEEGTFTPTSSAVTLTGTIAGHYTKIGDLVTVQCIFVVPTTSNSSDIEINGLPFNAKNGTDGNWIQGGCVTYHNQGGGPYTVLVANNNNQLVVYKANGSRETFNTFSNANLRLMATYKVA